MSFGFKGGITLYTLFDKKMYSWLCFGLYLHSSADFTVYVLCGETFHWKNQTTGHGPQRVTRLLGAA